MFSNIFYRSVSNSFCKLRKFVYQSLVQNYKYESPIFCKSFHSSSKYLFQIKNTRQNEKQKNINIRYINTNIQNNVILYKNNSKNEFILLKVMFYGWGISSILFLLNTYNPKYISTLFENISWNEYFKRNGLHMVYFINFIIIGPVGTILFYIINHRFIKYIILHKGGNNVSIITNHPLKNNYTMTLPINKIKIKIARDKMKNYLPMKIQGRRFYYIIDSKGTFLNEKLFDYTVGKAKNW